MEKQASQKVIIAGGGPAGLTAAYELASRSKIKPIVYEASDMLGGISRTVYYNGNRIDIGGHRFFSKSKRVMQWWANMMPVQTRPSKDELLLNKNSCDNNEGVVDPETYDRVMLRRNRVSRIYYLRKFFDYPVTLSLRTLSAMGLRRTIKAGLGYLASSIHKRPENSLEDFYINRFGRPLYKLFFEDYTEKVWGIHPSRLGADWGSQRVKGLSILAILKDVITKKMFANRNKDDVETSLIEEFIYPKLGPGQLWEIVANEAQRNGAEIEMNSSVEKITVVGNKVKSVDVVSKDRKIRKNSCDIFISSMPIKELIGKIDGIKIPDDVMQIASKLPYRDFITVGLLVNKMKIQNETKLKTFANRVPDTWIYVQERDVKLGRIQIFNNWSPYMVSDYENKMWIGLEYFCNENDDMWNMSDQQFTDMAIKELADIGIINREDVLDSVRIKVKKAYPAYYGSYYELDKVKKFLNGIENLYCIGRNGQHRYNNMDHSMLTAMETADAIINGTENKEVIWNVNTEKEYHEAKHV